MNHHYVLAEFGLIMHFGDLLDLVVAESYWLRYKLIGLYFNSFDLIFWS
jgi:hypothetical protein